MNILDESPWGRIKNKKGKDYQKNCKNKQKEKIQKEVFKNELENNFKTKTLKEIFEHLPTEQNEKKDIIKVREKRELKKM